MMIRDSSELLYPNLNFKEHDASFVAAPPTLGLLVAMAISTKTMRNIGKRTRAMLLS